MGGLRLALFDCDGTLVDSQHAIIAAMRAGFIAEGAIPPTDAAVRRVVGLPLVTAVATLAPDLEPARHDRIAEAYKDAFHRHRQQALHEEPLYPGLLAALAALDADGFLLGIATGKSTRGLLATLEQHGLTRRFVTLQTCDRAEGKPSPAMAYAAMAEAGVDAAATVVIGDTTYDVLMARNAGVPALGVAWGYHAPEELLAAGAVRVLSSYDEVPAAIGALLPPA